MSSEYPTVMNDKVDGKQSAQREDISRIEAIDSHIRPEGEEWGA